MKLLRRVNSVFAAFEIGTSTALLAILFVVNAYALVARYFFSSYPPWIIEVSEALLISIVFLGGAWLYRERRQIAVQVLVESLPAGQWPQRLLRAIGELMVLAFAVLTLWQAVRFQPILAQSKTPVLGLPKNVTSIMVPVAYLSILLASIQQLVADLRPSR